jgi:hypothetical protein
LHDCQRDWDLDLFQLINEPLSSRPVNIVSPFNDDNIEDAEQILALLDQNVHVQSSLFNEQSLHSDGIRAYMKR